MNDSRLRRRYWRIVRFFAGVTADFILWDIALIKLGLGGVSARTRTARYRRHAVRFRALALRMGGLMIKVGQFLSVRLDVLPREITDELSGLQDEVPAEAFSDIRSKAESELGRALGEAFEWVDETPLAAASLGQVHRARLRRPELDQCGFGDVVVKVQRPDIDRIVEVDLAALRRVGGWLQRYRPVADRADVRALVAEFSATTIEELDYLAEGRNAEIFAANFAGNDRIRVPQVVWGLSTRHVLTLEDVSAIKITDYEAIAAAGIDRAEVAALLAETYRQQILEDGFFHADPHPGNVFVTPAQASADERGDSIEAGESADGAGDEEPSAQATWTLTFVDFGMVGRIPDSLRANLREIVIAVGTQDVPRLVQAYKTMGVLLPSADLRLIETAGAQLFDRFWGMSMGELKEIEYEEVMRFGSQFRDLLLELPFQLPQNLLMLGRSVGILSGMCTALDPTFNLWTTIGPYASRLVAEEAVSDWRTWLAEAGKVLQTALGLPGRADRVLGMAERGELEVRDVQLSRQIAHLERSMNRVAGAALFSALMIPGALLYSDAPGLARWLMAASAVPFAWAVFFARGHRPPR